MQNVGNMNKLKTEMCISVSDKENYDPIVMLDDITSVQHLFYTIHPFLKSLSILILNIFSKVTLPALTARHNWNLII